MYVKFPRQLTGSDLQFLEERDILKGVFSSFPKNTKWRS